MRFKNELVLHVRHVKIHMFTYSKNLVAAEQKVDCVLRDNFQIYH